MGGNLWQFSLLTNPSWYYSFFGQSAKYHEGFLARPSHGGLGVDNTRVVRHLKGTLVENVGDNTRVETYGEEESNQEAIRVLFHSYRHYSCLIEAEDET